MCPRASVNGSPRRSCRPGAARLRRAARSSQCSVSTACRPVTWKALDEVFPASRHQRCWVHKSANVLNALAKSAQPDARNALQDICNAEDREHALKAVTPFEHAYGAKRPKAAEKIIDDTEELLAFCDFPAEHWIHLRTTDPIESTFATVRPGPRSPRAPAARQPPSPRSSNSSSPPRPTGGP